MRGCIIATHSPRHDARVYRSENGAVCFDVYVGRQIQLVAAIFCGLKMLGNIWSNVAQHIAKCWATFGRVLGNIWASVGQHFLSLGF